MTEIFLQFAKESILAPVLIWFMYQQKKFTETIILEMKRAVGKTILTPNQALDIWKDKISATTLLKLDFIRSRLEKNNLEKHQDKFKEHIQAECTRILSKSVDELNQFSIDGRIYLWDWVKNTFPMEEFLAEVYESVFMQDVSIWVKIQYIQTTIKSYNIALFEDWRVYFNKN